MPLNVFAPGTGGSGSGPGPGSGVVAGNTCFVPTYTAVTCLVPSLMLPMLPVPRLIGMFYPVMKYRVVLLLLLMALYWACVPVQIE